jgi:hypothetical protein
MVSLVVPSIKGTDNLLNSDFTSFVAESNITPSNKQPEKISTTTTTISTTTIETSSPAPRDRVNIACLGDISLCCKLCFEAYLEPVLLDCGHSVCLRCAERMENIMLLKDPKVYSLRKKSLLLIHVSFIR